MFYNPAPQILEIDTSTGALSTAPGPYSFTSVTKVSGPTEPQATHFSSFSTITVSDVQAAGDLSASTEWVKMYWTGSPTGSQLSNTADDGTYRPMGTPNPASAPATSYVNFYVTKAPGVGPYIAPGMTPNPVNNPAASWKVKWRVTLD
jgi:hypothetical protein